MRHRFSSGFCVHLAVLLGFSGLWLGCGEGGAGPGSAGAAGDGQMAGADSSNGGNGSGPAAGGAGGNGASSGAGGSGVGASFGGGTVGEPSPGNPSGTPAPVGAPDEEGQAWIFDEAEVHHYELTLDPVVWAALQANARDEQYAEADLRVGGVPLARVGLRFKGSLGTLASCFADDGTPRCSKLSMKLKFDEYLADQRLFGLKRLNFNSMLFEDSLMHERLAYRVFREMGVIAPRSVHARLIINGEDWGVFSLVEDVDGRFTKDRFVNGDGNLYKEAWPSNADADILARALETNEDVADHSGFLQFQADLLAATPADLPGSLATYIDIDQTLAYLAVDQTLVNWDGLTAFYCTEGFCENHNYYWYQDELEPRFALVPWDLDNTFESSPLTGVPGPFELPDDCSTLYSAMGRTLSAPGCDPLIQGLVLTDRSRYVAQLDRVLAGPFASGVLEGWIDELEAQLEPQVISDARGPGLDAFRAAVDRLRDALGALRERAEAERAAQAP